MQSKALNDWIYCIYLLIIVIIVKEANQFFGKIMQPFISKLTFILFYWNQFIEILALGKKALKLMHCIVW